MGQRIVAVNPRYLRSTEVDTLLGAATKAREKLSWTPKIAFPELITEMVREDLKCADREKLIKSHDNTAFNRRENWTKIAKYT